MGIDDETLHYNNSPYPCAWKDYTCKEYYIPCWSLAALLDILAKETHNIDEDGYVVLSSYKGNWWNISPINCISEEINESNNPIDAAFEMICWLKENGKL